MLKRRKPLKSKSPSYPQYLASRLWKEIRERVFKRDNWQCQVCGAFAEVVHHKSYAKPVKEGRRDSELVAICRACHLKIHFNGNKKISLSLVNMRLVDLTEAMRKKRAGGKPNAE